ncbi:MAG: protease inhibitor I42 family protein [Phascolarctobacterium sp.]
MMKFLLTTIICLLLCLPVFADQRTTILEENVTIGKATATLPYIDGSNDETYEKQLNALVRETAAALSKNVGGGSVSYEVKLNRPSLVSILLTATNGDKSACQGLNLDLTTGAEFTVTDFFVDQDEVRQALGDYERVLFGEQGFYLQDKKFGDYTTFVPYAKVLKNMRIGEAGRIMQVARLTAAASGKTLVMENCGLLAFKLNANPSTGYQWEFTADSPAVVKVGSSFIIPRGDEERLGKPGTEILFLNVQWPGTYKVQLEYKRPWEKLSLEKFAFTIIAKAE